MYSTINFVWKKCTLFFLNWPKVLNNCSLCLFTFYLLRKDGALNLYIQTLVILIMFIICKIKIDSTDGNDNVIIIWIWIFLRIQLQEKIVICLAHYFLDDLNELPFSPENFLPYKCFYKPPQDSYKNSFLSQHFHCDSKRVLIFVN